MTTPNNTPSTVSYRPGGSLSVQFGEAPESANTQGSLPGNHSGGRISYSNGVTKSESFQRHTVNQSDVVAERVNNADSILGTARTPFGSLGRPLNPQSVVTVDGMDMALSTAESLGYVSRNADGNYIETGVTTQSQQEDQQRQQEEQAKQEQDSFEFHPEHLSKLDEILAPLDQSFYDASVASAIRSGVDSLDYDAIADNLGTNKADAIARAQFVESSYRNVADTAVSPIVGEDVQAVWDWAAENRPEEHKAAIRDLVFANSTASLKALATMYMQNTIPDADTLAAGGFETKSESGEDFVKVGDAWMTTKAAARAGFI